MTIEFASQYGLDIFYTHKTPKTIANIATVYLNEAATGHSTPAKRGVNLFMVGRTVPSNSDNQNGDGGGLVCACARVCVRACSCVRAYVRTCVRACVL